MATSLRNLDFKNAASWPKPVKIAACALTAALVLFLGWQFLLSGQRDALASLEKKEKALRQDFEKQAARAANLGPLTEQLTRMEGLLAQQLRQLPTKTEMPDLIIDVSRVALSSGIRTELFQPEGEQTKEFYAEKPIQLRMVGTYHQFGDFVSGVASLPRVVIMASQNISLKPRVAEAKAAATKATSITPSSEAPDEGLIVMEGTVKTFRSLDEAETLEQEKLAEDARKKAAAEAAKAKAKLRREKTKPAGGADASDPANEEPSSPKSARRATHQAKGEHA